MKRRDFLKIGGGIGITGLVTGCTTTGGEKSPQEFYDRTPAQSTIRVRYEVNSPQAAQHLASYAVAVAAMKKEKSSKGGLVRKKPNGLNWDRQAEIHLNNCPHGTWAFFPWHRDYLRRFEDIIRVMSKDPNFTLPYWDWTANPTLPAAFKDPRSSLYMNEPSRSADPSTFSRSIRRYCNRDIVAGIMGTKDFESFMGSEAASGEAEYGPHNGVHITIGETMGTFRSPLDPIFWLHHCNVDRLWAEWQEKNPEWLSAQEINDKFRGWTSQRLTGFYDTKGDAITGATTAEQMLSTYGLNYCYDTTIRTRRSGSFNFLESKAPKRQPAQEPERTTLEVAAFTRDNIEAVKRPLDNQWTAWRISFPNFKGNVGRHLDGYMTNPADLESFQFRLKVSGMPKLAANTTIRISYDPSPETASTDGQIFLSNYNIFQRAASDQEFLQALNADTPEELQGHGSHHDHHGHEAAQSGDETMPTFNMDYKKLLEKLYQNGVTRYPRATHFHCEFVDSQGNKASARGANFEALSFKLVIVERKKI